MDANTAFGLNAGGGNYQGQQNVFIGNASGQWRPAAIRQVSIGTYAGGGNASSADGNIDVGMYAGACSSGNSNISFGVEASRLTGCLWSSAYPKCNITFGAYANQWGYCGSCTSIYIGAYAGRSVGQCAVAGNDIYLGIAAGQQTTTGAYNICGTNGNVIIGGYSRVYGTSPKYQVVIGTDGQGAGDCQVVIGVSATTNIYLCGTVSKSSGTFRIVHPNPKKKGKFLYHSFVEGPTRGENFYRWSVDVSGGSCSMKLPNYYKYLNENGMAWIYPVDHFGEGHAKVDDAGDNLNICADRDGCYNVLLLGTRCDEFALKHWKGTESDMDDSQIRNIAELRAEGVYK
jgi:hypothetical protein